MDASAGSGPAPEFNGNATIGAYQIGVLVSFLLLGIQVMQCYVYYTRFPDDSKRIKALVIFVLSMELAHAICISHTLYSFTILDFTHPERLIGRLPKSIDAAVFFSGLIETAVQSFFSYRIHVVSKRWLIPCFIWFLATLRMGLSIAVFVVTLGLPSLDSYLVQWSWLSIFLWVVGGATDLLTTVALCVVLHMQRKGAQQRTALVVDQLIVWTVETGVLTCAFQTSLVALYITQKENMIWLAAFVISSRLYSNSLLARQVLRSMKAGVEVSLQSMPSAPGVVIPSTGSGNGVGLEFSTKFAQGTAYSRSREGDV
ncbi:hypothetical protein R3P38DRAFT_3239638 [Favolaschia claudopus]|uniref:DUF6534 domain-containing protein n=1 Tax=Favolaschia claudopus TaxID=2862362 RepID=A0AAV9Z7S5_9AGAR